MRRARHVAAPILAAGPDIPGADGLPRPTAPSEPREPGNPPPGAASAVGHGRVAGSPTASTAPPGRSPGHPANRRIMTAPGPRPVPGRPIVGKESRNRGGVGMSRKREHLTPLPERLACQGRSPVHPISRNLGVPEIPGPSDAPKPRHSGVPRSRPGPRSVRSARSARTPAFAKTRQREPPFPVFGPRPASTNRIGAPMPRARRFPPSGAAFTDVKDAGGSPVHRRHLNIPPAPPGPAPGNPANRRFNAAPGPRSFPGPPNSPESRRRATPDRRPGRGRSPVHPIRRIPDVPAFPVAALTTAGFLGAVRPNTEVRQNTPKGASFPRFRATPGVNQPAGAPKPRTRRPRHPAPPSPAVTDGCHRANFVNKSGCPRVPSSRSLGPGSPSDA